MPVLIAHLFCFVTPVYALDITLAWDLNPYVDGYKIYYKTGSSGPPYNGTTAAEGDSPIDIGYSSEFTLRALSDDDVHYFTITAYKDDLESGYSNEVSTGRGVSTTSSSPALAAAGGGGGGCFITILQEEYRRQ